MSLRRPVCFCFSLPVAAFFVVLKNILMFLYRVDCLGVFYSEKIKKKKIKFLQRFFIQYFFSQAGRCAFATALCPHGYSFCWSVSLGDETNWSFLFQLYCQTFFFSFILFSQRICDVIKRVQDGTLLYREYFFSSTLHCLFLTQTDTNIELGWVGIAWMWCVNARACVAFFFFKLPIVALLVIPRDERLTTVFFFFFSDCSAS